MTLQEQFDLANNRGLHFETVHVRKDGTSFPVDVTANAANFGGERLIMADRSRYFGTKRGRKRSSCIGGKEPIGAGSGKDRNLGLGCCIE